jgi:predicted nuclease of predicted toxin-antitoxin system
MFMPAFSQNARRCRRAKWFVGAGGALEGELMAAAERDGRPRDRSDAIIAAVATANRCVVVTRNTRDFPGSEVLDPSQANVDNSA